MTACSFIFHDNQLKELLLLVTAEDQIINKIVIIVQNAFQKYW